ncbi:MAG TPA: dTDP-4-dehydrorhamnose 3,5-epimerase family protein [Acidimicrobiales bacterium]|nr:dTDP-4-dehydrorhamnose 3,5-epimerase family protein [Acidimicrobiales bacterium]
MDVEPLQIPGAWLFTPKQWPDGRGVFLEWYKAEVVAEVTGAPMPVLQANNSVSKRGVVRGIHFADVPPGQAKYVYCPRGAILDVIVDIRVGSPTFGRWTSVVIDDEERRAVLISEGLGHAFVALTDDASLTYLCSTPYNPQREHTVSPLDADLAIDWGVDEPLMSDRDTAAPSLAEARDAGLLPSFEACQAWYLQARGQTEAR